MELFSYLLDHIEVVIGTLIGLGAGIGITLYAKRSDALVSSPKAASLSAQSPVLGMIPQVYTRDTQLHGEAGSPVADAYRVLHLNLGNVMQRDRPQVLLVTSPRAQTGKSATSANLADSIARSGQPTLLAEADLRHPRFHELYGANGQVGFATLLHGTSRLDEGLVATTTPGLDCLPAAAVTTDPTGLLRQRFQAVAEDARRRYRLVVVDAPPVLDSGDVAAMARAVDYVLMTVQSGATRRGDLAEAAYEVRRSGGVLVGVVLTGAEGDPDDTRTTW